MTRMTAAWGDLAISAAVAFLGLFMWWGALQIETDAGLFEGPRLFPCLVATGLLVLAAVLAATAALKTSGETVGDKGFTTTSWRSFWTVALPLTGMLILYVGLFNGFGYLIATLLVAPGAFWLFGCRGPLQVVVLPTALVVAMYLLFFRVLGMFDPPGTILDLSDFF